VAVVLTSKSKKRDNKLSGDAGLIQTSLKRFQVTAESESETRKQGLEDLKFSIGTGQWDEAVKANREIEGKPCLTINRAPSFLRQYTGDERQHRPSMIVNPVGSGADIELAKIHQGVLRHIEVASFADVTYDDSYDWMMRTGWCPWRIKTDYVSEMSFDQEPRIEPFENPFNAYLSPVRNPLGQDPLWAHIIKDLSKEEYKAEYGKSLMAQLNFPTDSGAAKSSWVTKHGARVAEYWWIDLEPAIICQLSDGTVKFKKDLNELEKMAVEDERETIVRKVHSCIHNSMEILSRSNYLGKYIPLVDLFGIRLNINGRSYKAGMVRDYRDAQRIYDFMVTRTVEQTDAQGKDPLFVPMGATENFEEFYRLMNRKNFPYVPYQPYDKQDRPLPPPSRANRNVDLTGMAAIIKQADYDMKAVVGIYGPQVDQPGTQAESGFAILTRELQSDKGMISYSDNLNRAIRWQGKILLDLWPQYITVPKLQRIISPDDSVKHAAIFNSQHSDPEDAAMLLDGQTIKKAYDVGKGEYDVTLSAGPMSQTGRKEGFKALTQVIAQPAIAQSPVFLPILMLWAQNADFNGAEDLAKTLKKVIPPQFQEQDPADKDAQLAQQAAVLQQLTQQQQQLVAELARASDTIRTKRLDIESKERMALLSSQTQLTLQMMKDHSPAAQAHLQAQLDAISHRLETLHESMSVEEEAGTAPPTPELPGKIEPKVQPITPAAPTPPVPGSTG
jgi:Phage P22-like portal protein